ncbi:hypothetical protein KCU64_g20317, partial [Aureobasidium melanogenum]
MADGIPDMGEGQQLNEEALLSPKSVSTFGIRSAHNSAGSSVLTSLPLNDPTLSKRIVSVAAGSLGSMNEAKQEASLPRQEHMDSSWAPSLFVEINSQHLLFEDNAYLGMQSSEQKSSLILNGNTSDSTYLADDHKELPIDPSLELFSTHTGSETQARLC